MKKSNSILRAAAAIFLMPQPTAQAAIPITAEGTSDSSNYALNSAPYSQDFDSLPASGTFSWENDVTLPGWSAADSTGSLDTTARAVNGVGTNPNDLTLYSAGTTTGSDERALAYHTRLDTAPTHLGLAFVNQSGQEITSFSLAYSAEQWKESGSNRNLTATVQYRVGATLADLHAASTGWTSLPTLGFSTVGGAAPSAIPLHATDIPVSVPAGTTLWIRWVFTNSATSSTNSHDILAIDDVTFSASAVPMGDSPPEFTVHPVSQSVSVGAPVTFNATATGRPAPTYRWFKGNDPVAVAEGPMHTIDSADLDDAGTYTVIATNTLDAVTSNPATLTVTNAPFTPVPPVILHHPASTPADVGGAVTFSVAMSSPGPFTYQWFRGPNAILGATAASHTIQPVTPADGGSYSVTVRSYGLPTVSNPAILTVPQGNTHSRYDLTGFATLGGGTTGGGVIPETDPAYRVCSTALELVTAIRDANKTAGVVKVIEITADLNLGWNEIDPAIQVLSSNPLRSHAEPKIHPSLIASGVSLLDMSPKSGLTIFSAHGATIKHVTLNLKGTSNVIIRNLKFDEMWEWDEATKGDYDSNDWDFLVLSNGGAVRNVWIDHCTFTKAYDGAADMKKGTEFITFSWCRFLGDDGASNPNSHVRQQIAALELDRSSHPFYNFLRTNGFSQEDVVQIMQGHSKGMLMGATSKTVENNLLSGTFHHLWFENVWDRCVPRLRGGQVHNYNLFVDNIEALAARRLRDARAAAMSAANRNTLNNTYSFNPFLNGTISTEGGAILVEKSIYQDCITPLRNNQTDITDPTFTGKIKATDTVYLFHEPDGSTTRIRGDSTDPGNPLGPFQAPEIPFSWNTPDGSPPYSLPAGAYDDPDDLPAILAAGAGSGAIAWDKVNWLKTSYEDTPSGPTITEQPDSSSVTPGMPVTFSVLANGSSNLTYQWRKTGVAIEGATGPSHLIETAQATDTGTYDVVVYAAGVAATSVPATLVVLDNFTAWSTRNGVSGGNGDSDDDGIDNLIEYGLGLDPEKTSTEGLPTLAGSSEHRFFRFTRPNHLTGITYAVRSTIDLVDWSEPIEARIESATATTETVVAIIPAGQTKRFIKLEIHRP